jgi:murein DD-endopeptidase MepM/ murein hydrolase activator NlpD
MRPHLVVLLACAALLLTPPPATAGVVRPHDGPVVAPFDPPQSRYGPGHRGVDLAGRPGESVRAALPGTVTFAGPVAGVGWVTVRHSDGLDTTYGPLDPRRVEVGERVAAGQVLGVLAAGATHLDWGARRDGRYVDPLGLLPAAGARLIALEGEVPRPAGALRWPVRGRVSSSFGYRIHPVHGSRALHAGLDIAAPAGTRVSAAAAGTVTFAGWRGAYGRLVVVDHGDGVTTRYAHLAGIAVRAGDRVGAGAPIGTVGSSGVSTGPHLHFEVRHGGTAVDPRPLLP